MNQSRSNNISNEPEQQAEADDFNQLTEEDVRYLNERPPQPDPCTWCGGRLVHAQLCVTKSDAFQPRLQFGKHKNRPVREVKPKYLRWALNTGCQMSLLALGAAIEVVRSSGLAKPAEIATWEERLRAKELVPEGETES
ncbi:hypothetical protein [Bythopirellula goksoeyrii]|uniref:Uncharacterized protein n=1 Tax=Bythopirellula goksoeyrii TaxID=1400387 RepID=A0A5B9QA28_9BACT|nr:hypothetical protein [Bythopirellula goksoeyrii]QEG35904.1 hypothetical protein Pr1d_32110 [Bythopirellula goksoeyrii]